MTERDPNNIQQCNSAERVYDTVAEADRVMVDKLRSSGWRLSDMRHVRRGVLIFYRDMSAKEQAK